ncbi:hypothetical protein M0R45_004452 [Rubus argutus]|uniref:Uncharacterized protein n=1 Tax=Rubus argutus TaxID=59490 RepID=A0AAW1YJX9_RUBAR
MMEISQRILDNVKLLKSNKKTLGMRSKNWTRFFSFICPRDSKNVPLPGQENEPLLLPTDPGKENMMNASSSVSTGDDEEWAVENNEQLQEQEEYDEDEDGYEEEDEVHEDMHLEGKGSPDMENFVLCFNEGVEVGMPNDEFERSSRNEESTFVVPE